jgi:hypothetical protein
MHIQGGVWMKRQQNGPSGNNGANFRRLTGSARKQIETK